VAGNQESVINNRCSVKPLIFNSFYQQPTLPLLPVGAIRHWRTGWDIFLSLNRSAPLNVHEKSALTGTVSARDTAGIGKRSTIAAAELHPEAFVIWTIPHTWQVTNLRQKTCKERVNLEFDLIAKYVEPMLSRP
jgi:hypothetical protein